MKKNIFVDKNAEKELRGFSEEIQLEFEAYFKILELKENWIFLKRRKLLRTYLKLELSYRENIGDSMHIWES